MKKLSKVLWAFALFSCAGTKPLLESNPNGAEEMFASMRSEIDSLKGASKEKWISASGSHQKIQSPTELQELTRPILFTEDERMQLLNDFNKAHSTMYFGFDGNHHALVFFDPSGAPMRVEKW